MSFTPRMCLTGFFLGAFFAFAFVYPANDCPSTGSAWDMQQRKLNFLMNRATVPDEKQINRGISLEGILNSKDSTTLFSSKEGASVKGFVFDVVVGKPEPCNCYSKDENDLDIIIYLSKDGKAKEVHECAMAYITPASRALHHEWKLPALKKLIGKKITVTGWMLFNSAEVGVSSESHHGSARPDRHTAWEIHPVTAIKTEK